MPSRESQEAFWAGVILCLVVIVGVCAAAVVVIAWTTS